MKRRDFLKTLGNGLLIAGAAKSGLANIRRAPEVSITIDDPETSQTIKLSTEDRASAILKNLRENGNIKIGLFVCGKRVDNAAGRNILNMWNSEGHWICNHSYSHLNYNSAAMTFEEFSQDMLRGENIIKNDKNFHKLFRFPFLKEGDTIEKRDKMRRFLAERGYLNGYVTIDASDWYVDQRLGERLKKEPDADTTPYRDFYLKHIWQRASFYDDLSYKVLGRSIKHTILLHHTLLNALFLGDLIKMFKSKGWKVVNLEEARKDKVFFLAPQIAPAGESLIWSLAKETGKFDSVLRYPGEDSRYEEDEMNRLGL